LEKKKVRIGTAPIVSNGGKKLPRRQGGIGQRFGGKFNAAHNLT